MRNIYDITPLELEQYFVDKGLHKYRARQVLEFVYRTKIKSFDEITNVKKEIIEELKKDFFIKLLTIKDKQVSKDGTIKYLFLLDDGELIESVLMHHNYGSSICVTSEVGCNMGCKFCASGVRKKIRNLTTAEMVNQVMSVSLDRDERISHIVVMGIGEPFDNYQNVINFLHIANYANGLEIGSRHISVSTCGLVPKILDYANEDLQSNLAISLHAPNDEIRNKIMPINKSYSIDVLLDAIKKYIDQTNRRVTIEYILIDRINDTIECARELAKRLKKMNVYVNLIPYNEVVDNPFKRSKKENMLAFYDTLKKENINVTLRLEQGHDIDAACGQLRSKYLND